MTANDTTKSPRSRRIVRRSLIILAWLVTIIALFYAEEDWRGKRAYERCKRDMEAKGLTLDWDKFLPPPISDAENIFKAPKMQEWFVGRDTSANELVKMLENPKTHSVGSPTNAIQTEADARAYLAWSDQFQPQFDLIREALKRPYARMDTDYAHPMTMAVPNFVAIRDTAQTSAQRSRSYLLLHEPDKAIAELTFVNDLRRLTDTGPTSKPVTLVAAMINVAIAGLYANSIGEGFQMRAWQEPQLIEFEKQLSGIHLIKPVAAAFQSQPAAIAQMLETVPMERIAGMFGRQASWLQVAPHGWLLQNIASQTPFLCDPLQTFDAAGESVSPHLCQEKMGNLDKFMSHQTPYNFLARFTIPNFSKALQVTARNQNLLHEAMLACALERYRLANGQYPESLTALTPQFIEKIPRDVINGGDLIYQRTGTGFSLYSIGWNEIDDGGKVVMNKNTTDFTQGDWVWQYSPQ